MSDPMAPGGAAGQMHVYDAAEVDAYIDDVHRHIEELTAELEAVRRTSGEGMPSSAAERAVGRVLVEAQREAELVLDAARREADTIVVTAGRASETLRSVAERERAALIAEAHHQADLIIAEASREADRLVAIAQRQTGAALPAGIPGTGAQTAKGTANGTTGQIPARATPRSAASRTSQAARATQTNRATEAARAVTTIRRSGVKPPEPIAAAVVVSPGLVDAGFEPTDIEDGPIAVDDDQSGDAWDAGWDQPQDDLEEPNSPPDDLPRPPTPTSAAGPARIMAPPPVGPPVIPIHLAPIGQLALPNGQQDRRRIGRRRTST